MAPRPWDRDKTMLNTNQDDVSGETFSNFRDFADEQLQLLHRGFSSIPSLLHHLQLRGHDIDPTYDSHNDQQWQHDNSKVSTAINPSSIHATQSLLLASRNALATIGVKPFSILSLFRDDNSLSFPFFSLDQSNWSFPQSNPFAQEPRWLSLDWFKHSPYSPTNIEVHTHLHRDGSKWRAAFEDLISASLGNEEYKASKAWKGEMNDQHQYDTWAAQPIDWILGLQCRGILPPLLPHLYLLKNKDLIDNQFQKLLSEGVAENGLKGVDHFIAKDFWELVREVGTVDDQEQDVSINQPVKMDLPTRNTELDAYEAMLNSTPIFDKSTPQTITNLNDTLSRNLENESLRDSRILSTLTTTERTILPDGTATTKVVLKKRFSDGREECTETVSTNLPSHHRTSNQEGLRGDDIQTRSRTINVNSDGDKRGWFW